MRIVLGSKVVRNGYLDDDLKGKTGTVVAIDRDGWFLVQFNDWHDGHKGLIDYATKIKKGFTEGGNSCWWCPKKSLENVKEGVK